MSTNKAAKPATLPPLSHPADAAMDRAPAQAPTPSELQAMFNASSPFWVDGLDPFSTGAGGGVADEAWGCVAQPP